jgi:hypothetical protein
MPFLLVWLVVLLFVILFCWLAMIFSLNNNDSRQTVFLFLTPTARLQLYRIKMGPLLTAHNQQDTTKNHAPVTVLGRLVNQMITFFQIKKQ